MILFPSDTYLEVGVLYNSMVVLFLISRGHSILFSVVTTPIYIFTHRAHVSFSPHPLLHLFSLVFLIMAILTGVKGHHIVVLIFILLMTSEVENHFM